MSSRALSRILTRYHITFRGSSTARSYVLYRAVRWREGLSRTLAPAPVLQERGGVAENCEVTRLFCDDERVYEPNCPLSLIHVRGMAGHSKWQNIRHIKAAKDAEKAATNQKFTRMIQSVLRGGGSPDPKLNSKLGQVVEEAVKRYVPKATIENAIKNAVKSKESLEPGTVVIKGPGGCFVIIELLTDNLTRSKQTIRSILNKTRSSMLDGKAKHLFEHKGVINVKKVDALSLEKATEDAIVAGAEDIKEEVDDDGTEVIQFLSEPMEFYTVKKNLEEMKYEIYSSGVKYFPCMFHRMRDEDLAITEKLFDLLEGLPEVVNIYDNIE